MREAGQSVDTLREKIEAGERGGSEADRDALLRFSDELYLLQSEYSDHRHYKLLGHCTRMAEEVGGLADALDDEDAARSIVTWINRTYDNEETNRDYRIALRVFGKRLTDGDEPPDSISWVPSNTSRDYNPSPDPADMLRWDEDVKPMIDHAQNPRDKALLALQFDAGLRSGELFDLTVGDVTDGDHGLRVRVDGKTGQRSVTLVPSVPMVKRWRFEDHPRASDDDAAMWCRLDDGEQLSYRRYLDIFEAAKRRVDCGKPVTPTNFRKSNASWLARQGASAHLIEDRQGRARGSEAVARYVARFGDAEAERYAALHGMDVDTGTDAEEIAPVPCPRCGEETPADEVACVWCGQAIKPGAAEATEAVKGRIREQMAASDDSAERMALLDTLEEIESDPDFASDLIEAAMELHDSDTSSP